ncbi:proteasome subunit alpha [Micrococcoides hystricis]|uniref:Proteasome subunit alpha n=1 Tax=Micrococcoides hystricis TaxID=1572761 RepID=A0ABV6P797_9MICC
MTMPFYVSPEQLIKDRADFARKGISRGRAVIVLSCAEGIAFVADNPSDSLRKIGEIHDRIGFAAVGKYNEFEALRQAGVRWADVRAYAYDRTDVTGRGLASIYASLMASGFTAEAKPFEVELAVAEVGPNAAEDRIFRLGFDGSIMDEETMVVMGGNQENIHAALAEQSTPQSFSDAIRAAHHALGQPASIEVAVLKRPAGEQARHVGYHRCFTRYTAEQISTIVKDRS